MKKFDIYMLALEVRKWDYDSKKINLTAFTVVDNKEFRLLFTVSAGSPADMVEELLGKILKINKDKMNKYYASNSYVLRYVNEHFLRQKNHNYFKKILNEYSGMKKRKGKKGIYSIRLDIFSEQQDITFFTPDIRFFIYVNWARKYYEREQYSKVLEPLKNALELRPDFSTGYKWMARAYKKLRKYEESQKYYKKYAEVDKSLDARLELAHSYRKGSVFEKAEEIYLDVLKEDPENFDAKMGIAQIKYCRQESFEKILDELYEEKPEQVKSWLRDEWNYRFIADKKTYLNPMLTAKYLGVDSVFDLSHRAFKNEIPAHFNAGKARLSFYKEELDNWVTILNKYQCYGEDLKVYPETLKDEKIKKVEIKTDELGIDVPVQEKLSVEVNIEEKKQANRPKGGKIPKVEDVLQKFKKDVVIKLENEKELAQEIRNGNKKKVNTNYRNKYGKNRKNIRKSSSKNETANSGDKNRNNSNSVKKGGRKPAKKETNVKNGN